MITAVKQKIDKRIILYFAWETHAFILIVQYECNRQTSQSFVPRHNRFIGGQQPVKMILNIQTIGTNSNCKWLEQSACPCIVLCVEKQPVFFTTKSRIAFSALLLSMEAFHSSIFRSKYYMVLAIPLRMC